TSRGAAQQGARHVEADARVLHSRNRATRASGDHNSDLGCVRVLSDVRERFLYDADERDLLRDGHAGEVSLDALLYRYAGAFGERCDLVGDHARQRSPDEAAGLERMCELPEHTIELPDPCLEVVDSGGTERLALGGQKLRELSSDEEQVGAECRDVLERSVVQVERQTTQAPLAGADE